MRILGPNDPKAIVDKIKDIFSKEEKTHSFKPPISPGPDVIYVINYGAWADPCGNWLTEKCPFPCKWCDNRPEKWTKNERYLKEHPEEKCDG
jgi:hypothetical protein